MTPYRLVLTYHSEIGTFRGARGAWRVAACMPPYPGVTNLLDYQIKVGRLHRGRAGKGPCDALFTLAARRVPLGAFVNPTKLLREFLAKRRQSL